MVKHASTVQFDEFNMHLYDTNQLSPSALLLSGNDAPDLTPYTIVDITDHPHLDSPPFTIQLAIPPLPILLGCELLTDTYHNVPYIGWFLPGTPLAVSLLLHGRHNSSFWILSINSNVFITAKAVIDYIHSLCQPSGTIYVNCILAHCVASHHTSLAGTRAIFNRIHLVREPQPTPPSPMSPATIVPVGRKVISCPTRPETPKHVGQTLTTPYASDWKDALFQNYTKMLSTGTFSAPLLRSDAQKVKAFSVHELLAG